ncbi:MAG: division/cell wall cluster transcriptional repressor MraZ [Acidobacteria bacterium]|nr:division/cell wall cluster transcriptional repressor MraZ [Acidobacteriota bacterium]MBI3657792.1 division/cell wall cluster transcriptional repressor MraZ [Acidobacteriota bacterium]
MLRGNLLAKVDEKGRLKIPASFRKLIEKSFGNEVFITSLDGSCARIYPLKIWTEMEEKISPPPLMRPERIKFLSVANYWGQETAMDNQGRVLIHVRLREFARIQGEVAVVGNVNYLEVWNNAELKSRVEAHPFTMEDAERLANTLGPGKV